MLCYVRTSEYSNGDMIQPCRTPVITENHCPFVHEATLLHSGCLYIHVLYDCDNAVEMVEVGNQMIFEKKSTKFIITGFYFSMQRLFLGYVVV